MSPKTQYAACVICGEQYRYLAGYNPRTCLKKQCKASLFRRDKEEAVKGAGR